MKKTVKLNQELSEKVTKETIKAVDLIEFLLKNGFTSDKEPKKTSLEECFFNDKPIKKALFNRYTNNVILYF